MSKDFPSSVQLRQLKELLKAWEDLPAEARPEAGWIRSIREALGMSAAQLGARLGLSRQGVADLERREKSRVATLATLQKAAEALDSDLVYAIVPRTSLSKMLRRQARKQAEAALEGQGVSPEVHDELVTEMQDRLLRNRARKIWETAAHGS